MAKKVAMTAGQMSVLVSLMILYFICPTHSTATVVANDLINVYGVDANAISYMVSLTNLFEIPGAFIIGLLAGKKLTYRVCAILSCALIAIGGLPVFLGASLPWAGILALRAVLGFGLGMIVPVVMGSIAIMFAENENARASAMSVASVVMNVGMVALSTIGGILGAISWNYVWAIHLVAIIPLVLCAVTMSEKNVKNPPKVDEKGEKVKIKLPVAGWLLLVGFLVCNILCQTLFNLGGATAGGVVQNPAIVGTIFSCFSIGAIIGAALFAVVYRFLRAYTLPALWIVGIAGYVLWYVAHLTASVPLFYASFIMMGLATNVLMVGVSMVLSTLVGPAVVGAIMGFAYVFQNGGGFVTAPICQAVMAIFGADALCTSVWVFDIIVAVILGIALFAICKAITKATKGKDVSIEVVEESAA